MAPMTRSLALLMLVVTVAAACERRHPPDPRPMVRKALAGVPMYPLSSAVGMDAGEDAAQVTLASKDSVARVADWYRQTLLANGWTLQGDMTEPNGSVSIYAKHGKRPLWITLRSAPGGGEAGTVYTVTGGIAREDSASAPAADTGPGTSAP